MAGAAVWVSLHVVTGLTFLGRDPCGMGMVGTDCWVKIQADFTDRILWNYM